MTGLQELRRAIIAGDGIDIDKDAVIIGNQTRLDRFALTDFHSMRGRGDPYALESIYFQFEYRKLQYNDYVQACRQKGVAHVTMLDKKDLLAYLTGEITTCAGIVSKPNEKTSGENKSGLAAGTSQADEKGKDTNEASSKKGAGDESGDAASFAAHRKRDRDQRYLDSVLMVAEWDFSSLREKLAQHVASAKVGRTASRENGAKGATQSYDPRGDRYTSNEDRFWRENLGSEFHELGIDMSGSFKAKPSANANTPSSQGRRERSESRRSSIKEPPPKRKRIDPKELVPIIIVPQGSTLIYSGNAFEFFQNGRFLSQNELQKSKVSTIQGSGRTVATRRPGGNCSRAEYLIVSNVNRLTSNEWDRVVAVVCAGQEWQFKTWPINDKGVGELFRNIQGFYFHYDDTPPRGNVNSWAIKKLPLSRSKRHTDGQVLVQFWNTLDAFMRRKGKQLRY
eukprot:GFKZ01001885.1.p1 GENE.GFKZ01001885.1~~GFKZ01001885.1.p1  ORF type:complete len:452 (-),score=58.82 GFKZ01001885.1:305-1660(-)